jgi:hypothetical protein
MSDETVRLHGYDDTVLWILADEFPSTNKSKTEEKIRQKLTHKKLGDYDQERVDLLRRLKDAIQEEVKRDKASKYFTYPHGKKDAKGQHYVDFEDFDRKRMADDYALRFPEIPKEVIGRFVEFAVFLYYLK